ncbi:MAG: hypothetical protein IPN95_31005 [Bacteroidetes bacterium]|nr:hypothetical protein [Bacteroidota bacterium]
MKFFDHAKVEICNGDTCVRTNGRNADRIATAAALMLLLEGIGALISASR